MHLTDLTTSISVSVPVLSGSRLWPKALRKLLVLASGQLEVQFPTAAVPQVHGSQQKSVPLTLPILHTTLAFASMLTLIASALGLAPSRRVSRPLKRRRHCRLRRLRTFIQGPPRIRYCQNSECQLSFHKAYMCPCRSHRLCLLVATLGHLRCHLWQCRSAK